MFKKGQFDLNPIALLLGFVGGIFGAFVASRMSAGIFLEVAVFSLVAIVCYFVSNQILSQ